VVHPEVARRIACDCRLRAVLREPSGRAVGIGRRSRNVPQWLLRELHSRDDGCCFPGCGTRRFTAAHHIVHWGRGGATDLDNLVLVCRFHHKLVHEGGWRVTLAGGVVAEWFQPDGRRYQPAPPRTTVATGTTTDVELVDTSSPSLATSCLESNHNQEDSIAARALCDCTRSL
jgi:hypothetical protein